MRSLLLSLILLALVPSASFALGESLVNRETVITKLLEWTTKNALEYKALYGIEPESKLTYEVFGQEYTILTVSIDGYSEVFKNTGGPVLQKISGTNFRFLMNTSGFFFIVYTAFLSLMVGFFWFKTLSEVTTGKGPAAITPIVVPLIGKLAVGLIVAYNMPFVYGMAMKLKELGMLVVSAAFSAGAAENVVQASPAPMGNAAYRDNAIKDGVQKKISTFTSILDSEDSENPGSSLESGEAFLAYATSLLNEKIEFFIKNTQISLTQLDTNGEKTVVWKDIDSRTINMVGFNPGATAGINPYSQKILDSEQAKNPENILAYWMDSPEALAWVQEQFASALGQYIRLSGRTITNDTHFNALYKLIQTNLFKTTATSLPPLGADLEPEDLAYADLSLSNSANLNRYKDSITNITASYITREFIQPFTPLDTSSSTSSSQPPSLSIWETIRLFAQLDFPAGTSAWGLNKAAKALVFSVDNTEATLKFMRELPKMIAEIFNSGLKFFWIPALALLADFLFNVTIEAYVYVLMLAYPLWFYQKTAKAFTGALNSLVSVASTAAVFAIMIFIFEGFAGNILENVIGMDAIKGILSGNEVASDALGAGVIAAIAISPIGNAVLVGVTIGYAVFYTIGTGICLAIAPKIAKAFYNGSSVVTPMLMGAATAVAGGVLGGAMIGAAAAGAGMGGLPGAGLARGAIAKTGKGMAAGAQKMAAGAKKAASNIGSKLTMAGKSTADLKNMASAGGMAKVKASGAMAARGIGGAMGAVGSTVGGLAKRGANFVQERPIAKFAATQMAAMKQNPSAYLRSLGSSAPAKVAAITLAGMSGQMGKMFGAAGTMIYGQQMLNSMANRKESEGVNVSPSAEQISSANAETQRKVDNLNKDTAIRKKPLKLDRGGNSNNKK